jgi:hypothetical protein
LTRAFAPLASLIGVTGAARISVFAALLDTPHMTLYLISDSVCHFSALFHLYSCFVSLLRLVS